MSKRVLFVDDDQNFLKSLQRTLRSKKDEWEINYFSSALETLENLKDRESSVIVTDWNMQGMDGLEFCQKVKELKESNEIKFFYIILLTGKQGVENVVEALDHGADDFLSKPFDSQELIARIEVGCRFIELENDLRRATRQLEAFANSMMP